MELNHDDQVSLLHSLTASTVGGLIGIGQRKNIRTRRELLSLVLQASVFGAVAASVFDWFVPTRPVVSLGIAAGFAIIVGRNSGKALLWLIDVSLERARLFTELWLQSGQRLSSESRESRESAKPDVHNGSDDDEK